jgi:hypothetical protein
MMKFRINAIFSACLDMGGHIRTNKSAVAFFDWTLDSILINLNLLPRFPHPLSGIPPVQQRSGEIPHLPRKDTGQPRADRRVMQVLPCP